MTVRRLLVGFLAMALVAPAAAGAAARFSMPTPAAGDVTRARALVVVEQRGHRGLSFNVKPVNQSRYGGGVRAAVLATIPVRQSRRLLVDLFIALAAPAGTDADNPTALRLSLTAGGNRVSLARLLVEPNSLSRGDGNCTTLSDGFRAQNPSAYWLMARTGARWKGISPRSFAFDAYSYGCGDGVAAGGGTFAQALLAPLTRVDFTWRHQPDGTTRICEYITGAPGTRGIIELVGAGGSLGAQLYELSPDGYALVAWTGSPGTYHVAFRTSRASGSGAPFEVPPPPTASSPPPVELQLAAGTC